MKNTHVSFKVNGVCKNVQKLLCMGGMRTSLSKLSCKHNYVVSIDVSIIPLPKYAHIIIFIVRIDVSIIIVIGLLVVNITRFYPFILI